MILQDIVKCFLSYISPVPRFILNYSLILIDHGKPLHPSGEMPPHSDITWRDDGALGLELKAVLGV